MPFGDYVDFADCVAKNSDKEDPNAYCGAIKHQIEGVIHADFLKIYKQFIKHCKDETEGANRYALWVKALNLDDTQPYGMSRREQFQWIKRLANFMLWKEDSDAKYWKVEAGFPLESMNKNVYTERELELSARTLIGQLPNLNHKYNMKPVEIVAAEYEGGVVECLLRVPNHYHCPGCRKGKTLNDVIDEGLIVNVSLEAGCAYTPSERGACEGMYFTGLALLTKDVLPGIPLTRIMPLESIMVEALQTSTKTDRRKKKVKKIEMQIEQEDCGDDKHWDDEQGKCVPNATEQPQEDTVEPECGEGKIYDPKSGECVPEPPVGEPSEDVVIPVPDKTPDMGPGQRQLKPKSVMPDEHGQCPPGYIISTRLGNCILDENCPDDFHFDQDEQKCVPDTVPKPETPGTSVGTPAAPKEALPDDVVHDTTAGSDPHERPMPVTEPVEPGPQDVTVPKPTEVPVGAPETLPRTGDVPETGLQKDLAGAEVGEPKPEHECPDAHHYDYDANMCVPDTILTERVRRFKAEDKVQKAKDKIYSQKTQLERLQTRWEKRYGDVDTLNQRFLGNIKQQSKRIRNLESSVSKTQMQREELRVELRQFKSDYADKERDNRQQEQIINDLKIENATIKKKYHGALATNLDLSRKNTVANEDYLAIAKERDELKDKVTKARTMAKKTLKIRI